MKKALIILAVFGAVCVRAQEGVHIHVPGCSECEAGLDHTHTDDGVRVERGFVGIAPRFGLSWQKEFFFEAGVGVDIYRIGYTEASEYVSFFYHNLRPYVAGEIMMRGDKTVGGPKAGIEFIMSSNLFGMAAGGDFSWYTDGLRDAVAITPRLMLSFVYVEVYYGYNFFICNDLQNYIGKHRIGVSCVLNPKFWKRKKQIYESYYESYL